ncbi:hypothetical protein BDV18DRAFT_157323 [Aspergillus unguis]
MTLFNLLFTLFSLQLSLSSSISVPSLHDGDHELSYLPRDTFSVSTVSQDLRHLISPHSAIFGPDDNRWENATERYTTSSVPDIQLVVRPALEGDVPIIVKYCNAHTIPFLAVNRGHAVTSDVGRFRGIQIDLAALREYTIQPDEKSAWFQGGSYGGSMIESLWERGFVVTTGSCTCVGLLGPALGGGHGRLEGQYGLVSDNLLNLNVVLANGSTIRVNATSHPDLWWTCKAPATTSESYIWRGEHLETVFTALNEFHGYGDGSLYGTTPVLMGNEFGEFLFDKSVGDDPLLSWTFAYAGPNTTAESLLAPFNAIPSISSTAGDGTGLTSPACALLNNNWAFSTVNLARYNVSAERAIYEHIWRNGARYMGIAIPPNATAELANAAWAWVDETRDLWNAGQPGRVPSTYINYAVGEESVEAVYGEEWRVDRLKELKERYDPLNRFRFYNPIIRCDLD